MKTIRLYNIDVPLDDDLQTALEQTSSDRLGLQTASIDVRLVKRGVDARGRTPKYNCTVDVDLTDAADVDLLVSKLGANAAIPEVTPPLKLEDASPRDGRVVVVGSGPAGAFAAYVLALNGCNPLLIERGRSAPERLRRIGRFNAGVVELDPDDNALFGEGGAGSFSDGKLYTSNKRDAFIPRVLQVLHGCGAPESILTDASPHVGTDILTKVVVRLREKIEQLGGEFRFSAKLTDVVVDSGVLRGVEINGSEQIDCDALVLATGHSARDTFEMLLQRGVAMEPKPFQLGVRIEHPQGVIDKAQLGRWARDKRLTPAAYDLSCKKGPGLFSFCMCPGGITIAAVSEPGYLNTNGMSFSPQASGYANSALVTTFDSTDFGKGALDGVAFQRRLEKAAFEAGGGDYSAPAQNASHYLRGVNSPRNLTGTYARGRKYTPLAPLLPDKLNQALHAGLKVFDKRVRGFVSDEAVLHAVEARASSPVRLPRNSKSRQSTNVEGLYPCGEGAGYAGGIISAALDGIRSAHALIRHAQS
ncbi:MAG: NAD(P)/FAD-dependent oxidoreductase [Planctomycetota bacterium]